MPCACARLSFSGLERVVAAFFIIASTSTAIALTLAFNEWGLCVLAISYIVAFFLLLTGLTKWRPFKHCCYQKAGNRGADPREGKEARKDNPYPDRDEVL